MVCYPTVPRSLNIGGKAVRLREFCTIVFVNAYCGVGAFLAGFWAEKNYDAGHLRGYTGGGKLLRIRSCE
jgi:hypothetical protein